MLRACALGVALAAASTVLPAARPVGDLRQEPQKKSYRRANDEGTLTGTIIFEGEPPERTLVQMHSDSVCSRVTRNRSRAEEVIVSQGRLANVLVYVKSTTLDSYEFEPPQQEAVLERRKCRTVPRVLGVRVGQTFRLRNSDQTTHNYNLQSLKNEKINTSLPPGAEDVVLKFETPEQVVPVKCNQHPWEKGYVGVFSHPFFAVSDRSGFFTMEGLPPGRYTVVAWHERLGAQTAELQVGVRESKSVDFTFKARAEGQAAPSPWDAP
jgi:hypothetical protein